MSKLAVRPYSDEWRALRRDHVGASEVGALLGLDPWRSAKRLWAEKRGLWFNSMRYFEIEALESGSCIFANGFIFSGLRGEMYFDRHRKALRSAVDAVAEGMKAAAE